MGKGFLCGQDKRVKAFSCLQRPISVLRNGSELFLFSIASPSTLMGGDVKMGQGVDLTFEKEKNMKKVICSIGKGVVVCCSLSLFLIGCTIRLVDFTVISSKNVSVPTKAAGKRVAGEDCAFFGIPNMKEAIDRAIESGGGNYDALVDGVLYEQDRFFQRCFKVEGTPINTKAGVSMNQFEGKELLLHSSLSTDQIVR